MQRTLVLCLSLFSLFSLILFASLTLGGPSPETMEISIHLDSSAMKVVKNGERDFLILKQPRCVYPADPDGAPIVPSRLVRVVVPREAKFQSVSVTQCVTEKLAGTFDLDFVRAECPPGKEPPETLPDKAIYGSDNAFPASKVEFRRSGLLRGYKLFFFRVNPIQYLPKSKELLFHKEIGLKIEYTLDEAPDSPLSPRKTSEIFRSMLERSVENPSDIDAFSQSSKVSALSSGALADGGPAEYLIICADAYKDSFQPLADWKKQKGITSKIVTVESIETDYTGEDTQEKIKLCIIDHVNNNETIYVLLGGDTDTIPHRQCYVQAWWYQDATVPCDLYYQGLDDIDWNDDDDFNCGELESEGDTIDMDPDVFVGRYSCLSAADVQGYVNKVIEYEKLAPSYNYCRELNLTGIKTWYMSSDGIRSDVHAWSQLMYQNSIAPYWSPTLIETFDTTPSLDLTSAALKAEIDNGHGMFNMMTHGLTNGWSMEVYPDYNVDDASAQANDMEPSIIYTIACYTNSFDGGTTCLSEAFLRNPNGGAVAYIGCARYGWGDPGSVLGGRSIILNGTYYMKLLGEDLYNIGQAYTEHKWEHTGECATYNPYRWIQIGISLLGDPELPVWTDNPQTMSVVHSSQIAPGSQTFHVKAEPGAVVCLWKTVGTEDEVYVSGKTDDKGGFSAVIDPATIGTLKLTVTKHNFYPYEADITVTDSPGLYISTAVLPDGEPGFAYSAALEAGGGAQPYTWSMYSGSLPDGLALNGNAISGTPLVTGTWFFTVQVQDSSFNTILRFFDISIILDAPDLHNFTSPDYDGNYTAAWSGSDAPTHYELQESVGFTDSITDNAESGMGLWTVSGFTTSTSRCYSTSQSYYGGYAVDLNNTLTYADTLAVGGSGQISYWCWYDTEDGNAKFCDFAFLEISLNGGATWIRSRTYGGNSGGWVQETVDLSAYAGQNIKIRFRYYTSHMDLKEGFYVDDIAITGLKAYNWTTLSSAITEKYYDIAGRAQGIYYYRVRAFDAASSSNWSDIKPITVSEAVLDLYDNASHTVSTTTVCSGQTFSMGLDTGRTGAIPVGPHTSKFYFSENDTIASDDYFIGAYSSTGFDAGYETQAISVNFPGSIPEGTYFVGCIIDSDNEVGETNESNNNVLFVEQITVETKYTLSLSRTGSGSVSKDPDQALYDTGDSVTISATPDAGWHLDSWTGDATGIENPLTISMNSNMSITAVFIETQYTLATGMLGNGVFEVSPSQDTYYYGDTITLAATPEVGWTFSGWEGDVTGAENPIGIDVYSNLSVTAVFTQIEYTLTVEITGSGTVATSPQQATYHYGDEVSITAIPDTGNNFIEWQVDITGTDNPETIIIDGNKNITALFTAQAYIPADKDSGGGCSCSIDDSRNNNLNPETVAGYILPLIAMLCMLWLQKRRNSAQTGFRN